MVKLEEFIRRSLGAAAPLLDVGGTTERVVAAHREHRAHSRHGLHDRPVQPVVQSFLQHAQDKAQDEFFRQIGRFCVLAAIYIVIAVYRIYLNQMLQIRWRRWLTERYLKDWLADRNYYRMQLKGDGTDNPDQRIAEDFRLFVENSLSLDWAFSTPQSPWVLSSGFSGRYPGPSRFR